MVLRAMIAAAERLSPSLRVSSLSQVMSRFTSSRAAPPLQVNGRNRSGLTRSSRGHPDIWGRRSLLGAGSAARRAMRRLNGQQPARHRDAETYLDAHLEGA